MLRQHKNEAGVYQNQLNFDAEVKFYNAPNAPAKLWSNYVNMRLKTDPQLGRIIGALNPAKVPDSWHLKLSQCCAGCVRYQTLLV